MKSIIYPVWIVKCPVWIFLYGNTILRFTHRRFLTYIDLNLSYIHQADEWDVYCQTTVGFFVIYEEKIHCCGKNKTFKSF